MLISDVSVRRPVFAAVISLILVILGVMAASSMTIREYPAIERPIVSISTSYRGAASDIVERRVTQILEDQLAGISGISKISSTSMDELSSINIEFMSDVNIDAAANDVRDRISRMLNFLPEEADPPIVAKQDDAAETTMWINVSSDSRSLMEVSDSPNDTSSTRWLASRVSPGSGQTVYGAPQCESGSTPNALRPGA